jgi:hypothetical protein
MNPNPTFIAYGGGTNSAALVVGMVERGMKPVDLILFANTGGEKPHTYDHLKTMSEYLAAHGWPAITVVQRVRRDQTPTTLEERSLETRTLPSLAYGFKTCSQKFKLQPQDKFCNHYAPFKAHWKAGGLVTRCIGYDFAETRRWMNAPIEVDHKYRNAFPLVEWEWVRQDCVDAILRAGLPLPGKSSCFYCPASTTGDIDTLRATYPVLFHRALAMEANAAPNLKSVKGLGRRFNWAEYAAGKVDKKAAAVSVAACGYCVDFEAE